jgi:hypothetical protein
MGICCLEKQEHQRTVLRQLTYLLLHCLNEWTPFDNPLTTYKDLKFLGMPCTKHFINMMTFTTSIVEILHATDYLNDVVFFNIFFGRSCYPVKRKNTLKKYFHKSLCTKSVWFYQLSDSCSPTILLSARCKRSIIGNTFLFVYSNLNLNKHCKMRKFRICAQCDALIISHSFFYK